MFCGATRGGGAGRGRKKAGDPAARQDPAEADAAAARAGAADAAQDVVKDAGDQLADAIGGGVDRAEGVVADTQAQGAVSIALLALLETESVDNAIQLCMCIQTPSHEFVHICSPP